MCLLVVLSLAWFGRSFDRAAVFEVIRHADWRLIAVSVLLVCASLLVRACRWRFLLASLVPDVRTRHLFAATAVGFGAIALVGRAGELVRPAFLSLQDARVRPGMAYTTSLVERVCDMVGTSVLFAVCFFALRLPGASQEAVEAMRRASLILLLFSVAVVVGGIIWFKRHHARRVAGADGTSACLTAPPSRAGRIALEWLTPLAGALAVLAGRRGLLIVFGWTALLYALMAFSNLLLIRSFGLAHGPGEAIFLIGWAAVGLLVPTPGGGAGTFHAATAAGLVFMGVAQEAAAAAAIILHLVTFAPSLVLGLYYFASSNVSLARLRDMASSPTVK